MFWSRLRNRLRPAGFIEPCLPRLVASPPAGPDWIHEIKYDGFRMIALRRDDEIRLWSRNGNDWNNGFPLLVHALLRLKCRSCVIDTEVVAHNEKGVPDFKALRRREPPSLYAFDLLQINGIELRQKPIETRREALRHLISGHGPAILYSEEIDAPAELAFEHVCKLGLEGIVSKRRGMAYESGRSQRWLKTINPNAPARQRLLA